MGSTTDYLAYDGYSKLLPSHTRPYQVISVEPGQPKVKQNGIENTVSISLLTKVGKEGRPKMDVTSDSKSNTNTNHAPKSSIGEDNNSYIKIRVVAQDTRPTETFCTVQ